MAEPHDCMKAGWCRHRDGERVANRRARERDLGHDADPERFGRAMLKCEGFAPDCSYHGRCSLGGTCFTSAPNLVAARMVEGLLPTDGRAGAHLALLRRVAEMLRADKVLL